MYAHAYAVKIVHIVHVYALLSGSDYAEDVSLDEIKPRLQSLIDQLDNHPALPMEQHRAEPGSSDMDIHVDDSVRRSEITDTHGNFDNRYVAGTQRLALLVQHCTPWYSIALLERAQLMPVNTAQHNSTAQPITPLLLFICGCWMLQMTQISVTDKHEPSRI